LEAHNFDVVRHEIGLNLLQLFESERHIALALSASASRSRTRDVVAIYSE
jgi:hypothetical protein